MFIKISFAIIVLVSFGTYFFVQWYRKKPLRKAANEILRQMNCHTSDDAPENYVIAYCEANNIPIGEYRVHKDTENATVLGYKEMLFSEIQNMSIAFYRDTDTWRIGSYFFIRHQSRTEMWQNSY